MLGVSYVDYAEKAMAPHSSTLAWQIPWTEEPGRLQEQQQQQQQHVDYDYGIIGVYIHQNFLNVYIEYVQFYYINYTSLKLF